MKKENLKRKIKSDIRGITLVSLGATIIVLIILAGVSINLIFDRDGLFNKANATGTKYNNDKQGVADNLESISNEIKEYNGMKIGEIPPAKKPETEKQKETTKYTAPDGEWYIPKGFREAEGSPERIKDGKVIRDEAGNEWVWIPCYLDDNGKKVGQEMYSEATEYKRTAFKGENITSSYKETANTTDSASIKKYGGYYIGRYEAGAEEAVTSADTQRQVLIQKGKHPYNYITLANCETKSSNFASDNNYEGVYTKLSNSYAWDTALCFIQNTVPDYATNSIQGNYEDHKFSDSKGIVSTGSTIAVCNIYDMGGNLWEYTSESYGTSGRHAARGGNYGDAVSAQSAGARSYYGGSGNAVEISTFRLTLYILI